MDGEINRLAKWRIHSMQGNPTDKVDNIKVEIWLQLRNRNMTLAIKCMFGCKFVKKR